MSIKAAGAVTAVKLNIFIVKMTGNSLHQGFVIRALIICELRQIFILRACTYPWAFKVSSLYCQRFLSFKINFSTFPPGNKSQFWMDSTCDRYLPNMRTAFISVSLTTKKETLISCRHRTVLCHAGHPLSAVSSYPLNCLQSVHGSHPKGFHY